MYEKEKQRENHLIVLLVYTFFSLILTGESLLLGWEVGAIVLLLTALIGSWVIYITDMVFCIDDDILFFLRNSSDKCV